MFKLFFLLSLILLALSGFSQITFRQETPKAVSADNEILEAPWAGGLNSPQFSEMDLDEDGDLDLVVFDRQDSKVRTFISEGEKYTHAPIYESNFPPVFMAGFCSEITTWTVTRTFSLPVFLGCEFSKMLGV